MWPQMRPQKNAETGTVFGSKGRGAEIGQEADKKPASPGSVSWQDRLSDGQEAGRHALQVEYFSYNGITHKHTQKNINGPEPATWDA
jgi:hypothetical protein